MKPLRLRLRADPEERVDLSVLTASRLAGLDAGAIERLPIGTTRSGLCVGDLFRLRTGDPSAIEIEGGSDRLDGLATGMASGVVRLDGDAGARVGQGMTGGTVEISGSVGPLAACGMRGGMLEIGGDAGDHLGGAMPGERTGMRGGSVIVRGNAGAEAASGLRRGLILIEGDAGAWAARHMVAGTLVVCGSADTVPGVLMRRGTLLLGAVARLPASFVPAGAAGSVFLRVLAGAIRPWSRRAARLLTSGLERYAGDMAGLGKGEILVAVED